MSRQDYEAIAQVIADNRPNFISNTGHAEFAMTMAAMLAEDNERFDTAQFIMAAMPRSYVGTRLANVWERAARKMAA